MQGSKEVKTTVMGSTRGQVEECSMMGGRGRGRILQQQFCSRAYQEEEVHPDPQEGEVESSLAEEDTYLGENMNSV